MHKYLILLFFTSILISCKTRESSPPMTDIRMSVDKRIISDIDLSLCDTILLENSDEALMYNVDQILPGNNEICIWGRNKASLFRYDGSFIKDLGTKGRGPGEYLDINSLFRQNNLYCIYDWQNRNILKYDAEGNFIGDERIPRDVSFSKLVPIGRTGKYAALNTYRGVPGETPALAIYDSSFKEISHSEKKLLNGSYHLVPLRVWNDEVLFTDLLCDTLYSLTPDGSISAKYHLNFGEQTLPGAIDGSSRSSDRAAYWNLPQNRSLFSAVAIPVCQDDIYLYIPYIFGEGKLNLLCYDKRTGKSHAYRLWDPVIRQPVQFTYFTVHGNNLYFVLRADEETADNPLILRIGSEIFSNQ